MFKLDVPSNVLVPLHEGGHVIVDFLLIRSLDPVDNELIWCFNLEGKVYDKEIGLSCTNFLYHLLSVFINYRTRD